ncbi:CsbD family protein [Plastoroseomonas hellenica]|uniref:CsbD family protein n=1 Tax=Plastoroseomonas hellenica TaxID=2687306 RepID=UPI001BA7E5DA|nr:CsbD family protein [Plastoroseomonas hellenica]MBR0641299.1 CsbD family protein [Plastoroseomonas hellenica]
MNKDQVTGAAKQAKGAVKDGVGGAVGSDKMQAEGKMDKAEGKIQKGIGDTKEEARDALKR